MLKKEKNYLLSSILYEYWAIFILFCKGYIILKHRYRNSYGEIDIVATKNNIIVAIEVKYRKDKQNLFNAINYAQQQRISNSLEYYISKSRRYADYNLRYDGFFISKFLIFNHIKNFW